MYLIVKASFLMLNLKARLFLYSPVSAGFSKSTSAFWVFVELWVSHPCLWREIKRVRFLVSHFLSGAD